MTDSRSLPLLNCSVGAETAAQGLALDYPKFEGFAERGEGRTKGEEWMVTYSTRSSGRSGAVQGGSAVTKCRVLSTVATATWSAEV